MYFFNVKYVYDVWSNFSYNSVIACAVLPSFFILLHDQEDIFQFVTHICGKLYFVFKVCTPPTREKMNIPSWPKNNKICEMKSLQLCSFFFLLTFLVLV